MLIISKKKEKGSLFGGAYPIGVLCLWIVEPSLRLAQSYHSVSFQLGILVANEKVKNY